jgi:hypothetical protein
MSILDKTTTLREIENENYYGGWILKDRIILVANEEEHPEIAIKILVEILKIDPKKLEQKYLEFNLFKLYSLYRIMYRLGFIRLTLGFDDEFLAECSKYTKPNKFQQDIINKCLVEYVEIYFKELGKLK